MLGQRETWQPICRLCEKCDSKIHVMAGRLVSLRLQENAHFHQMVDIVLHGYEYHSGEFEGVLENIN